MIGENHGYLTGQVLGPGKRPTMWEIPKIYTSVHRCTLLEPRGTVTVTKFNGFKNLVYSLYYIVWD